MAFLAPIGAWLAANSAAITAGTVLGTGALTAGEAIHSLTSGGPSTPTTPTGPTAPTPQAPGTSQAQKAAVSSVLPNLQALTGGSVSPEYAAQFGTLQAGLGNDPQASGNVQEAINKFFGLGATGNSGLTPSSSTSGGGGILDLLSKASPGTGSGGGGNGVSQQLLDQNFSGFA